MSYPSSHTPCARVFELTLEAPTAIAEVFARNGWSAGWMGYPLGGEVPVSGSNPIEGELNGWVQLFQGGRIYRSPVLDGFQVASINGLVLDEWLNLGGSLGYLGFPIADEAKTSDGVGRSSSWRVDETYIRVGGRWCYL